MRGEEHRLLDAVRNKDDSLAAFAPDPQHFKVHLLPGQGVQRSKWLIHQDHLWVMDEGARNRRALLHPARQLLRILVLISGKPDELEKITRPGPRGLHRQADDLRR